MLYAEKHNKKKVLVLFAHPAHPRSEVNISLFNASKTIDSVTAIDLYHEYPTFQINIDKEQQRLLEHDVIIFLFPFYWYSTPAILKEWQDLVLEYGFAYGGDACALKGKTFLCAFSAGASKASYSEEKFNRFSIRNFLRPMEQMAYLTQMQFIAPFVLFSARTAVEENRLNQHIDHWLTILDALSNNKIDLELAAQQPYLNQNLSQVIRSTS